MNRFIPPRWRWTIAPLGALVLSIALAIGLAPSMDEFGPYGLRNWGRSELDAAVGKVFALRDSASVYRAAWELADTRERAAREAPVPAGLTLRADANVPPRVVAMFAERAQREVASLAASARHPIVVRLLVDSTPGVYFRRGVVIPATTSGPCMVQVRLTEPWLENPRIGVASQVLGVCGLYAKFGAPGEGMTKFLTRTSLVTASYHTAEVPPPPFNARQLRSAQAISISTFSLACAVGRLDQCTALFEGSEAFAIAWRGFRPSRMLAPRQMTNALRVSVFSENTYNGTKGYRLAELRATLGDDRFQMLWSSKDEPAVEFARREGRPLEALVSEQLRGEQFRYRPGSAPYGAQLMIALLMMVACGAWVMAKAPREYRA